MKKYTEKEKENLKSLYIKNHLRLSEISKKYKTPIKTLYRFKKLYNWDEYLKEQAKTMYLEQRMKLPDIARVLQKPIKTIIEWKENDNWDKEIFIIGNIGLARELNTEFIKEVQKALKEQNLTDPSTADKLAKLLKIIEKLNPQRIQLANIYQLLSDLTEIVTQIGDDEFSKLFQKHLVEMSNWLREKYAE